MSQNSLALAHSTLAPLVSADSPYPHDRMGFEIKEVKGLDGKEVKTRPQPSYPDADSKHSMVPAQRNQSGSDFKYAVRPALSAPVSNGLRTVPPKKTGTTLMEDVSTYRNALLHHINALLDKGVDLKVEEYGGAIQLCDKADGNLVVMMGLFPSYFSEGIDLDTIYNCMLHAVVNGIAIDRPNAIWVSVAKDIVAFLESPNAPQTVDEMASFSCFILADFLEAYKPP